MKKLSAWSVEAWLLSDELAKEIESNSHRAEQIDRHSAEATGQETNEMPLLATAKQPTSKLEAGSYNVICTGIIEDALPDSKFTNDIYRFYFDVENTLDEEGNQATTDAISSRTLSPKSKLWGWLIAFGLKPEVGTIIDLETVIGKRVMAVVAPNDSGEYNRVVNLVPLPKGSAKAPVAAQEAPQQVNGAVNEDTISAWWTARLGEGFQRKAIIDLCAQMFQGAVPGKLNAEELAGLTDEMNRQA